MFAWAAPRGAKPAKRVAPVGTGGPSKLIQRGSNPPPPGLQLSGPPPPKGEKPTELDVLPAFLNTMVPRTRSGGRSPVRLLLMLALGLLVVGMGLSSAGMFLDATSQVRGRAYLTVHAHTSRPCPLPSRPYAAMVPYAEPSAPSRSRGFSCVSGGCALRNM